MPIIDLELDRNGADFVANQQAMLKQIDEVAAIKQKVLERSLQEKPKVRQTRQDVTA
jgi:geranyl-CoA carboxylase beta subunit